MTAIIFPLDRRNLYPANARGLVQVLQVIDESKKDQAGYISSDITRSLDKSAVEQLADRRVSSWSWKEYSSHYEQLAAAIDLAKKSGVSAFQYIGRLGPDWHPAGYSKIISEEFVQGSHDSNNFRLLLQNGNEVKLDNFGARAFLLPNVELIDLRHVVMIHFANIDTDRIPELRGRFEDAR